MCSVKRLNAVVACLFLSGCVHSGVVIQLYDQGQRGERAVRLIEDFASERAIKIERPQSAPPLVDEGVTVVYGSHWRAAATAWTLAEQLSGYGSRVNLRPNRLQNHMLTGNHIGIFVRQLGDSEAPAAEDRTERISQLTCSTRDGDAVVLLFGNGALEIQSYIWDGTRVGGREYVGTWQANVRTLSLDVGGQTIRYEATGGCLPIPDTGVACETDLRWIGGRGVPILEGCMISARNIVVTNDRSSS